VAPWNRRTRDGLGSDQAIAAPEMDLTFKELIDRLQLAQELVHAELEQLAQAEPGDHRAALWLLSKVARTHQDEATSMLVTMFDQSAPEDLLTSAELLAGFFNGAVRQIDATLRAGWGSSWGGLRIGPALGTRSFLHG
jgi:hypothetical protein